MKNVLVIEDEHFAAQKLIRLVQKLRSDYTLNTVVDSVEGAANYLKTNSPDLIFCDIHLADGSSFAIFEMVEVNSPIIFTTAYNQYALQAFKVNSIDYLLKPIQEAELEKALLKFESQVPQKPAFNLTELANLLQQNSTENDFAERLMVFEGTKIKSVEVEQIALIYTENKTSFIVYKNGNQYTVNHTLDALEQRLNPKQFFRVNRQFIVNYTAIEHMLPASKGRLEIITAPKFNQEIVVSTERSPKFKKWIDA